MIYLAVFGAFAGGFMLGVLTMALMVAASEPREWEG